MKKIVLLILMCIFISSFAEKIETFDKFDLKLIKGADNYASYLYLDANNKSSVDIQLSAGNYLLFSPAKYARLSVDNFLSDVIGSEVELYTKNKKGKETFHQTVLHNENGFTELFSTDNSNNEKIEFKKLGIVFANIEKTNEMTYRLRSFTSTMFLTNSTFYIKKVSDTELIWASDTEENEKFFFKLEDKKVKVTNKSGKTEIEWYRDGDSLIIEGPAWYGNKNVKVEIKVDKQKKEDHYIENGKEYRVVYYQ